MFNQCGVSLSSRSCTCPIFRQLIPHSFPTFLSGEHENLVKFVGVAVQQAPWLAVIEFCQYGDLRAVVKACKEKKVTLLLEEQLSFCHQLASGCAHLASKRFIHMDLASNDLHFGFRELEDTDGEPRNL